MCPAQRSLWLDSPEGCFVTLILGLGALAEDSAESPCAQHGFSKAYHNPGSIHTNPERSGITARLSLALQLWPRTAVRTPRGPAAEPLLVLLHLEGLP